MTEGAEQVQMAQRALDDLISVEPVSTERRMALASLALIHLERALRLLEAAGSRTRP